MCNKKLHATRLCTEKDQTGRDPSFHHREIQFHLMASGMNFAYYVLYRFWINPLSHKFLIGTIELYRGQGKIWKHVWIFFPVVEHRIHIFLHIHLVWHKGNSLAAFFQLSLLLHSRNIILLPILFPHRSEMIQRHSRSLSSVGLEWITEKEDIKTG